MTTQPEDFVPVKRKVLEQVLTALLDGLQFRKTGLGRPPEQYNPPAISALRAALEQPGVEPVSWMTLHPEAERRVKSSLLYKRFIDGTPLSNDIPCWMTEFALEYAEPQPAQQNDVEKEALLRALHAIDTVVVALPTFQVNTDGGIDAVAANIVTAIKSAADLLENGGAAPQPAPQPDARTSAIQSCIDRLIQGGKPAEAGMLRHHFAKDLGEE